MEIEKRYQRQHQRHDPNQVAKYCLGKNDLHFHQQNLMKSLGFKSSHSVNTGDKDLFFSQGAPGLRKITWSDNGRI